MALVYGQDQRVADWVAQQLGYPDGAPPYSSIGYERGGELVAGVLFDNMTGTNLFAHIASTCHTLPVEFLAAVARFAYVQCGVRRMTFMVHDDNERCIRLVESLGAVKEATLRMGHPNGHSFIYVLWDTSRFYRKLVATGRILPLED